MTLTICVVNAEEKFSTMLPGKGPIEDGSANTANMKLTRWTWSKSRPNSVLAETNLWRIHGVQDNREIT